ncbi:hypothetical protein [Deinococcus maricopensis]|uniref:Uncharacterized protein n=1 Tax=Deinococcus maricopensis (strain DSM 21211 / LMG 22137 / NRRL B-23946 / LB-34) TaxID=709986 RepID=E8U9X6_DEIML|nr:hypothetical protein [Deinococcus maricopensis]ADV67865.1 hypothetical protein Deima_2227 [Deinococcus maricopensis DSM 21211]
MSQSVAPAQKTAEAIAVLTFALTFVGLILERDVLIIVGLVLFVLSLVLVGMQDRRR